MSSEEPLEQTTEPTATADSAVAAESATPAKKVPPPPPKKKPAPVPAPRKKPAADTNASTNADASSESTSQRASDSVVTEVQQPLTDSTPVQDSTVSTTAEVIDEAPATVEPTQAAEPVETESAAEPEVKTTSESVPVVVADPVEVVAEPVAEPISESAPEPGVDVAVAEPAVEAVDAAPIVVSEPISAPAVVASSLSRSESTKKPEKPNVAPPPPPATAPLAKPEKPSAAPPPPPTVSAATNIPKPTSAPPPPPVRSTPVVSAAPSFDESAAPTSQKVLTMTVKPQLINVATAEPGTLEGSGDEEDGDEAAQQEKLAPSRKPQSVPAADRDSKATSLALYDSSDDEDEADEPPKLKPQGSIKSSAPAAPPVVKPYAPPAYAPMDQSLRDELLCEGYLTKIKGSVIHNRTRYFRLTASKLTYFEENCGKTISSVQRTDIRGVDDVSKSRFRIRLAAEIGRNNAKSEILLEAANQRVKEKWIARLNMDTTLKPLHWEELLVEGYLTKVQPLCTTNTTRWFIITARKFIYLKDEAGDVMSSVSLGNIESITPTSDSREFKVLSNVPMTKSGFYDAVCRAPNQVIRDKWVVMLQRVLPQHKIAPALQMCCYMEV